MMKLTQCRVNFTGEYQSIAVIAGFWRLLRSLNLDVKLLLMFVLPITANSLSLLLTGDQFTLNNTGLYLQMNCLSLYQV